MNLETVPILFEGIVNSLDELEKLIAEFMNEPSAIGSAEKEGVVVRNADKFKDSDFSKNVIKWIRKGHVQTDEHWTKNWKKAKINYEYNRS